MDEQGNNSQETQSDFILLTQIAVELGKRPHDLAKLAKEGVISAEKRGTRWYANKEKVRKELQRIRWIEKKFSIQDWSKQVLSSLSFIGHFLVVFLFISALLFAFSDRFENSYMLIDFSPGSTAFFLTIAVFFLIALSKATRTIEHAGNIWKYFFNLRDQISELNERIEILEKSVDMRNEEEKDE